METEYLVESENPALARIAPTTSAQTTLDQITTEPTIVRTNTGLGGARQVELGMQAEGAGLNYLVNEGSSLENIASQERFNLPNGRGIIKPDLTVYENGQLTDVVEVKGGSASGTIAETQLTNYNDYAATRGVRLTYILLREPSRPFLDLLRRYEVRIIPLY